MKVLDLHCRQAHVFEGWFGSEEDFQSQIQRSLVQCPFCGDDQITKRLSAPRLNFGAQQSGSSGAVAQRGQPAASQTTGPMSASERQSAWLEMARSIVANTEDVGASFAMEARRMHFGEARERPIRGHATADEALQLLDEGVPVIPLSLPVAVKDTLQ